MEIPLWFFLIASVTLIAVYLHRKYCERNVSITILIDRAINVEIRLEELTAKIKTVIQRASAIFEKEFAISFSITDVLAHDFPDESFQCVVNDYLTTLKSYANTISSDIILTFTTKNLWYIAAIENDTRILKECRGFGDRAGAAIIRITPWHNINTFVLAHELGHVFEAIHCEEPTSIMIPTISIEENCNGLLYWLRISPPIPRQFDSLNKKIIFSRKFKKFSKEFPSPYHIEHRTA